MYDLKHQDNWYMTNTFIDLGLWTDQYNWYMPYIVRP